MQPQHKRETSHRIRLRGPWNVQNPAQRRSGETAVVHFPQSWGAVSGSESGVFHFSRRFGCPTGVGPQQVVLLEIVSSTAGDAVLNEKDLGSIRPGTQSFDVTSRLGDGNQIDLALRRPEVAADAPIIEVAVVIETRETSFTPPPHDMPPSR